MPADWQLKRLHSDAIPVTERLPGNRENVVAWVSDEAVSIYHFPVIAWRIDSAWWAGLPGNYIDFARWRWTVTHWKALAPAEPTVPVCMEDLIDKDAAERVADPVKAALLDCIGALSACMDQIHQMRGMFDDADGTIQDALDAAEDAQAKAREAIG